jgi:hypothetical protein
MSGTYPSSPAFETVNFKINTPTLTTETLSGKRRRVGMGHSFYTFSAKYSNIKAYDFGPIIAFQASQYGPLESFQIVLPQISYSKSPTPPSTTPQTSATVAAGVNSVALSNCGNTKTVLAAGDYFKFNNHTKVYMCVTDCISNSGGAATLFFSGSLVSAVPSGTQLTITAVPFTVILDNDVQEYSTGTGGISTMSVDLREVW